MFRSILAIVFASAFMANFAQAFVAVTTRSNSPPLLVVGGGVSVRNNEQPLVVLGRLDMSSSDMADDFLQGESPADTQERIQGLVDEHPVLLFMKGSKLFPQCGFSNTATQILES